MGKRSVNGIRINSRQLRKNQRKTKKSEKQEKYYSEKKKNYTFKNQIITTPKGTEIVDVIIG